MKGDGPALVVVLLVVLAVVSSGAYSAAGTTSAPGAASPRATVRPSSLPLSCTTSAICPFGISDQGFDGLTSYSYSTPSVLSSIHWTDLAFKNSTLTGNDSGDPVVTDQLNAVLQFTQNGTTYAYWIQDVFALNTGTNSRFSTWFPCPGNLVFFDNIWNFTTLNKIDNHTGDGHGEIQNDSRLASGFGGAFRRAAGSAIEYYGAVAAANLPGNCVFLNPGFPDSVQLKLVATSDEVYNSTAAEWTLVPGVQFYYRDLDTSGRFVLFDSFNFTFAWNPAAPAQFSVSLLPVPAATWLQYDAESIVGGDNGGFTTDALSGTSFGMSLEFYSGHNFETVPSAWDYAVDSAEKVADLAFSLGGSNLPTAVGRYNASGADAITLLYARHSLGDLNVEPQSTAQATVNLGVGGAPNSTAVDQNGNVWVTESNADTVAVVNGATAQVEHTVPVGGGPTALAFDSRTHAMYVANSQSGTISVVSTENFTVVATVDLGAGSEPRGLLYVPFDASVASAPPPLLVSEYSRDQLVYVNDTTEAVVGSVPTGAGPLGLAYSSDLLTQTANRSTDVYVADYLSDSVSVVGLAPGVSRVVQSVSVGSGPAGVAYHAKVLAVTDFLSGEVTTVYTAPLSVVNVTYVGQGPWGVAYSPSTGEFLVTVSGLDSVRALAGSHGTLVGVGTGSYLSVGSEPRGITYDPFNGLAYVADNGSDALSSVSGYSDVLLPGFPIPANFDPVALAYDSGNGELYVAGSAGAATGAVLVYALANDTLLDTIPLATSPFAPTPYALVYDSQNGYLYVSYGGIYPNGTYVSHRATVAVIDGATHQVVATLGKLDYPLSGVFDPANGYVYLTNLDPPRRGVSANVTVIRGVSFVANVSVSPAPYGPITYDSGDQDVYVVAVSGITLVLSGTTVIATFASGVDPSAISYDPVNSLVYEEEGFGLDLANNTLYGIASSQGGRTNLPQVTVPLGSRSAGGTWAVAYDPVNGHQYFEDATNLTDLSDDSNRVAYAFEVGSLFNLGGSTLVVDPQTGVVYLADADGRVAILDPSAPIESGTVVIEGYSVPYVDGNANLGLLPATYPTWTNYTGGVDEYLGNCTVRANRVTALPVLTLYVAGISGACEPLHGALPVPPPASSSIPLPEAFLILGGAGAAAVAVGLGTAYFARKRRSKSAPPNENGRSR